MEFEQIIKRLDWLDEEHRKDKIALDTLKEQLANTESELKAANKRIKELNTELSQLSTIPARMGQYDGALAQQRTDIVKHIDALEGKYQENLQEIDKRYKLQFNGINKSLAELRTIKEPISEIKRELRGYADEDIRLSKMLSALDPRIEATSKATEEIQHAQKVTDEAHRHDNKRLADLQGEISAARKRMDEVRGKNDLFTDSIRRVETRLNEILTSEAERRQAQTSFLESQALSQVERDRIWKELEERLGTLHKQTETMDRHLQDWDSTQRALKRAQETYEEIAQKFERRINEITEMQRLAEDHFRQEWVTFKADDQKRWTSYTISQDEIRKDVHTGVEKLEERLTVLEDLAQTQQDVLQQTKDANEQLFQGMLAQIHELLSAYERIMSTK
jgi:chromosome segregation ATPase